MFYLTGLLLACFKLNFLCFCRENCVSCYLGFFKFVCCCPFVFERERKIITLNEQEKLGERKGDKNMLYNFFSKIKEDTLF